MWQLNAACADVDSKIFFSAKHKDRALALSLCNSCPVKDECLEFAINNECDYGIFGGLFPEERKALV